MTAEDRGRLDRRYWRAWLAVNLSWWWRDARMLAANTARTFGEHQCTHLAAGISYYVLFSIFPLALLLVAVLALILDDPEARADLVDELLRASPFSGEEDRQNLDEAIDDLTSGISVVWLVGVGGLLWSASGMMGALRRSLNMAWGAERRRPYLRGKLLDFVMVLGVGLLGAASLAATILLQLVDEFSDAVEDVLGGLGVVSALAVGLLAVLLPLVISFLAFLAMYRLVPSVSTRVGYIWPGALIGALAFEVLKYGFAIYIQYFGNYDEAYGPFATVIAFLFFVYLSANTVLVGAEVASEWPRVANGQYDGADDGERGDVSSEQSLTTRVVQALVGLVASDQKALAFVPDEHQLERRRRRKTAEIAARHGEGSAAAD